MAAWLVVGLGNPGPTYASTRHNVGFMVADELAARARTPFTAPRGMRGDVCETRVAASGFGGVGADAQRVVLLKPRTFMNESGAAVAKACAFFKIDPDHVVAVHDELDLDFGQLRLKFGGGDNGHNGLRSMRSHLGTGDFFRARFGIGRPPGRQDAADFVLRPIPASLREDYAVEISRVADAVEALLVEGLTSAQNRFNS
ncbi:aminoacyl-tRNA hydrolase [Propioniciclava sp. MC1595]|uniref:aminoacyl-tRNA hydrolase n=1 Tax=Propioniciclava sp. MC1595 TaxID=2760308 RepID=UPI0016622239|nr:aminoacyl-tRNA hydrolase [Propioniciclava sp. MC1595]MBB1494058.1 aminoacyl-tRNA hydrolase [Propioniciclava sp. MC1595]QTE25432.1 aminoacyl-tRNA hydrolase [Propioniciclava sp. MC1595]